MAQNRYDETWHRLREWTKGQTQSERLAAQILIHEGFSDFDPSHPLGGRDGGKDAIAIKGGVRFAMAVHLPRGQQSLKAVKAKFEDDLAGARHNSAEGIAFVTNQELRLGEREDIKTLAVPTIVELYHLERITTILDTPGMAKVRQQFLDIEAQSPSAIDLGGRGEPPPALVAAVVALWAPIQRAEAVAPVAPSTSTEVPEKRRAPAAGGRAWLGTAHSVARAAEAANTSPLR